MEPKIVPYARAARTHLKRRDPVMARIIREVGPCRLARRPERFQALVRTIMFQQLAGPAATAIYNRFVALFPGSRFPTPAAVLAAPEARLRSAGLSGRKALYVRDLAERVSRGEINFRRFARMDDESVIAELIRVKGIGRWTAEIFLMFNLGRPDVLPLDDLGLRNAITRAYGPGAGADLKSVAEIGELWRPYRSAASWYLWRSLNIVLPDGDAAALPAARKRSGTGRTRQA